MQTNMLATVFGASGFLGRHTVRALAKTGWRIKAVCRRPNLANYLTPAGSVGQIELVRGNIHDDEAVAKAVEGADAVLNLTGVLFGHGEQSFEHVHVEAARRIAKAAKSAGAALLHVSAIGADIESDSSYAASKARGERAVREEHPDAVIVRPSVMFGPEDKFFNKFAAMARYLPFLPLIGAGHTRLQPAYVADVAGAVQLALADSAAAGKTYELGGPSIYTFKELMEFILHETGRHKLLVPVPFFAASVKAFFLQMPAMILPVTPLLTMDQVRLLRRDNVVSKGALTFNDVGITPHTVEAVVPGYLWRFHPKGQFRSMTERAADQRGT
ncbi:MAG: complex I NDUFA9 subunit family protein [Alphaproteobacteria bacterium]|nr:complex I NDUFA9 subunit family protein [Alphaproteobacteria bacterium]